MVPVSGPLTQPATSDNVGKLLIVTVKVLVLAHWPAVGVKVYVPLALLLTVAGDQLPGIAGTLLDEVVSAAMVAPAQNGPAGANTGVTGALMTIVKVALVAHCPAFGVKV